MLSCVLPHIVPPPHTHPTYVLDHIFWLYQFLIFTLSDCISIIVFIDEPNMCWYYISFLVHFSLQLIKDCLIFFWFALFSVYLWVYLQTLWQKSQPPWYADTCHQFTSYMCFMNNSLLWTVALQAAASLILLFSFPITLRIPFTSLLYCILFSGSQVFCFGVLLHCAEECPH